MEKSVIAVNVDGFYSIVENIIISEIIYYHPDGTRKDRHVRTTYLMLWLCKCILWNFNQAITVILLYMQRCWLLTVKNARTYVHLSTYKITLIANKFVSNYLFIMCCCGIVQRNCLYYFGIFNWLEKNSFFLLAAIHSHERTFFVHVYKIIETLINRLKVKDFNKTSKYIRAPWGLSLSHDFIHPQFVFITINVIGITILPVKGK